MREKDKDKVVAEEWKPTFENVTREFVTGTLYKLMFSEKLSNIRFDFREQEAINFIEKTFQDFIEKYNFDIYKEQSGKVLHELKSENALKRNKPVIIINDYKKFFEYLRQYYEGIIELYFERTNERAFSRTEKDNSLEQVWLRMTPSDFNNPEEFLEKQAQMIKDKTFEKYNEQTYLGELDGLVICVKNGIARTWDENARQIEITAYEKKQYESGKIEAIPHYILPLIRYGIYEKDGKKICRIGSIQNKDDNHKPNEVDKKVNRVKYKANQGVPEEDTQKVEPKNLLALSIFINMLNCEGITEIEIPSMYVLDYEYHEKLSEEVKTELEKEWPEEEKQRHPDIYERQKQHFDSLIDKQDLISEIKTERLLLTFRRLLQHYSNAKISSYPEDTDNFMHMTIPKIKSENDINGSIFQKIYNMQEQRDTER